MASCPHCFTPLDQPPPPPALSARPGQPAVPPSKGCIGKCRACNFEFTKVDSNWANQRTTCIAMAGARTTGKSIYIAVMIKQLEYHAEQMGMAVRPATQEVADTFNEKYLGPLYKERRIMDATRSVVAGDAYQKKPLIFVIRLNDGSQHHLVIRDVAGEDLEEMEKPDELTFFARADGVFFLFDPLKIDVIRDQLHGVTSADGIGGDPRPVMDNTLRLVSGGTPKLAVILSKFDTLQALRDMQGVGTEWSEIMRNRGAAIFRDPGAACPEDSEQLHEEVRSLLIKLRANSLVNQVERAGARSGHRFFAVSALGGAPRGKRLSPRGIAPYRCLDPLRWAMADSGVFG
jgi:hypothetical protein